MNANEEYRKITSEEHKKILLEITDTVAEFCHTNGIRYFLSYGTLLGAVRHKGFIPWDDDFDITVPRNDYERLVKTFNKGREDRFQLVYHENSKEYYLPFAKVMDTKTILSEDLDGAIDLGVNIDVFPLDYCSNDIKKAKKLCGTVQLLRKLMILKSIRIRKDRVYYKNTILLVSKFLLLAFPLRALIKYADKKAKNYIDLTKSKYCAVMVDGMYGKREIMELSWYSKAVPVEFEKREYQAPACFDKILTNLYGDYMKMPPKHKQITHHLFCEYWKK